MGWFNDIGDAIKDTAEKVGGTVVGAAETAGGAIVDTAQTVGGAVVNAGGVVVNAAETAGGAIANTAESAAYWTAGATKDATGYIEEAANATANWTTGAANSFSKEAVSAWKATSEEAQALGTAIEGTGFMIGEGFISGANTVKDGLEIATEKTGEGLVSLGKYISNYACDIAIGTALSTAFIALAADGEEETYVGAITIAVAAADQVALRTLSRGLAKIIATPVYLIPGVSDSFLSQDHFEDVISFIIFKACFKSPKLVVSTGGQFIAGALIYGITSVVCEGKVPGGYTVWKGVQASL